jgi:hypothetical protein
LISLVRQWGAGGPVDRVLAAAHTRLPFVDVSVSGGARALVVTRLADVQPTVLGSSATRLAPILAGVRDQPQIWGETGGFIGQQ